MGYDSSNPGWKNTGCPVIFNLYGVRSAATGKALKLHAQTARQKVTATDKHRSVFYANTIAPFFQLH